MYLQVPEKIKMLEINLSFLQSYMEETKKGHDESFEDISSEVEHLKSALAALKAEVLADTADMASRFKTLEDKWSVMEAEHKVTAEKMEEQQRLLEEALARQDKTVEYDIGSIPYTAYLEPMVQMNQSTKFVRQIKRHLVS